MINRCLKRIKRWFDNKLIREKINIIYIALIIGQMVVLSFAANYISTRIIISKTVSHSVDNSKLVMLNIEDILDNIESYSNDLTVRINNYFIDSSGDSDYNTNLILKKIFRNTLYVYPRISSAMFILPDGSVYASDNVTVNNDWKNIIQNYFQKYSGEDNGIVWMGMEKDRYTSDSSNYILTLGKKVININTGDTVGLLLVTTRENVFSSIYQNMGIGKTGQYFICDNNGIVVSSSDNNNILKPINNTELRKWVLKKGSKENIIKINGKKMLVTAYAFPKLNWQLVGIVPLSELTKEISELNITIIIIGILCMITAVFLSNILSVRITRPIYKLIDEVRDLKLDNLNVPTNIDTKDDIGLLTKNFNSMKKRISDLMSKVLLQQEKQKKYEFKLLQAQIKPHFLYNALQLIYSLVEMDKKDQAKKATKSLADFYRTALSSGDEIIPISQEIKNVEDYLYIQNIRYSDLFTYEIDVPDELKNYKIMKLTLQPIVENCIKHGLKGKEHDSEGKISIKGSANSGIIVIEIADNGVGIKAEDVQHIFDGNRTESSDSFGLRNIDERIKLFYGQSYGLEIRSEYLKGTSILVYIPAIEDMPDDDI